MSTHVVCVYIYIHKYVRVRAHMRVGSCGDSRVESIRHMKGWVPGQS